MQYAFYPHTTHFNNSHAIGYAQIWRITDLREGILKMHLRQQPVNPVVAGKKDGIILAWLLLQLDGDGNEFTIPIHNQQTQWRGAIEVLSTRNAIKYLQIADVQATILQ